jgi:hypothetical protein
MAARGDVTADNGRENNDYSNDNKHDPLPIVLTTGVVLTYQRIACKPEANTPGQGIDTTKRVKICLFTLIGIYANSRATQRFFPWQFQRHFFEMLSAASDPA